MSLYNDVLWLNNSKHHPCSCYKSSADQNGLSDVIFLYRESLEKLRTVLFSFFFFGGGGL